MSRISINSVLPYRVDAVFNTRSLNETVVYPGGVVQRAKISDTERLEGRTILLPVASFIANCNIHKCNQEKHTNSQKICDAESILYVIGTPNGDDDPNRYVVFTERYGMHRRNWSNVALEGGVNTLTYTGTQVITFDVPMIGYRHVDGNNQELFNLIILPRGKHVWVYDEWAQSGDFRAAYGGFQDQVYQNGEGFGEGGREESFLYYYQPILGQVPPGQEDALPQFQQPYQAQPYYEEGFFHFPCTPNFYLLPSYVEEEIQQSLQFSHFQPLANPSSFYVLPPFL